MFRRSTRVPQRFGNLLGVALAILAVLWIGTGGHGQPAVQDKIKRKLVVAEQFGLEVPGAKAAVRFAKSADGRASLEFLDTASKRSLRLSVASTGSPALFVTTSDPDTTTSLGLGSSGAAALVISEGSPAGKQQPRPRIVVDDSGVVSANDREGHVLVMLDAQKIPREHAAIAMRNSGDRIGVFLQSTHEMSHLSLADGKGGIRSLQRLNREQLPSVLLGDSQTRPRIIVGIDAEDIPRLLLQDFDPKRVKVVE